MILLTRAMGGERFYASVLKTIEAINIESQVNTRGCFAKKRSPTRAFLHSLFNSHATLTTQYAQLRRHGLSLNFTQSSIENHLGDDSACENAKLIMQENENLFKLSVEKVEFGNTGKKKIHNNLNIHMGDDLLRFHLPLSLQPGFDCVATETIPEDLFSPLIPLLRYIGPSHLIRLLSALLCERRIILISKSITRLSMCVRAASSILAQGLLQWRHILIPVLPPHMINFLSVKSPFLVGILYQYAPRIKSIEGLSDVFCVNVDTNELNTVNMANPRITVPDMLKKNNRKTEAASAAEMLANDLEEIFLADQKLWQHDGKVSGGKNEKQDEIGLKAFDYSAESVTSENAATSGSGSKINLFGKLTKQPSKSGSSTKKFMSLEEKRQYATSLDAAVAFGKMIRSNCSKESGEQLNGYKSTTQEEEFVAPKYSSPSLEILGDIGSIEAWTFWLDRRKFLLRKKQLGLLETSPMFLVVQKFSSSPMFELFVKGRIDDIVLNDEHQTNRCKALTADNPFDGDVALALSGLVESCRECNTSLSVVMSTIWYRIGETKTSLWRHQLLALYLLKTLLLHGPLTVIAEALDGAEKIYDLRSYSNKSMESIRGVRGAADQVYDILTDLSRLLLRRRRLAFAKIRQEVVTNNESWGDYIVRRLPATTEGYKLHNLFRPDGVASGRFNSGLSVAYSVPSNQACLMTLERLDESLRRSGGGGGYDDMTAGMYAMGDEVHSEGQAQVEQSRIEDEELSVVFLGKLFAGIGKKEDSVESSLPINYDGNEANMLESFNLAVSEQA
ncbi:predicted protein [Thalassiosira pseudonana CCMP1335]|uniref:UDENN domain-containing protein n=1 Tax=Thalassiosira pseudonana TaxID=35128 RepID=B8C173_THAPS|nr:predicted protein [Thalassiosira pseudonana CCMP1335]EED92730.1 predicted protein [Thalassiosira pseudonana CCMP1335]